MRVSRTLLVLSVALASAGTLVPATNAVGQDVVELYQKRRMASRATMQSFFRLDPMPLAPLVLDSGLPRPRSDSSRVEQPEEPAVAVFHVRRVPKFARKWFEEQFEAVDWAYDGGNTLAPLDTMFTREIRARLEHAFGAPTRTLGDQGPLHRLDLEEYIQFEYWFLINGEWPVIIMDVNGPFERGVVVSAEAVHREHLIAIRDAVLAPILKSDAKSPFADYFFEPEVNEWYLAGYDGVSFFLRPVRPRSVNPGRPATPVPPVDQDSGTD